MNSLMTAAPLTMSSREIAEVCGKQHKHVLRDIEKMLLDIDQPKSGPVGAPSFGASEFEAEYTDAKGQLRKEYRLPKDLTVTLITGYRADLRYKVVKRLEEMEQGGFQIPKTLPDALRLAAEQAQQIEDMREDVAAHERLAKADGSLTTTEAAKNLGLRPKDLFQWLSNNKWIYKRPGASSWLGYQTRCNTGDLEHKTTTVLRADGSEKITEQVRVTAKGLAKLAKLVPGVAKKVA
jgi:phage regulator Rha-like protein